MAIVGAFDVHRSQLTYDYVSTVTLYHMMSTYLRSDS